MPIDSPIVNVIFPNELQGNGIISRPDIPFTWSDYKCHYLAEGDSWFSMSDILSPSFLYRLGNHVPLKQSTLIVNCAYPGDTLKKMVDWTANLNFFKLLHDEKFGWEWDGILLSAGGNDVIDAALSPAGILKECANPASYLDFIDGSAMNVLKDHLKTFFQYLVNVRDTSEFVKNRSIPIYYHTYGHMTPRSAPASFGIGPWLYTALTQKNIPVQYWQPVADTIIDELGGLLRSFTTLSANLKLVDTLANAALTPASPDSTGSSGDWLNEIHLNNSGKDKLATYWATFL
ncbi:MAG TPA: hypothetical protein VFK88_01950 [Gallionella sp.]|nr:hypothetical protein [Gallionella sp.]